MSKWILAIVMLFSLSLDDACAGETKSSTTCIIETGKYETMGFEVAEGVIDSSFEPGTKVIVEYSREVCSGTGAASTLSDLPDLPQIGDTRTITQVRGDWIYIYTQTYTGSGWFTTEIIKRFTGQHLH
ncbi:hypothetical protein KUV89_06875 [Marinobacter hydrocarbonoclasticus]|nr:hypothetical protein [Marinobacter nauticus]